MSWAAAFFWVATIAMFLGAASFWGLVALAGFSASKDKIEAQIGKVGTIKSAVTVSKFDGNAAYTKAIEDAAK